MSEYPKDLHEIKSSLHDELREMRAEQKVSCDRNAKAHERLISSTQRLHGDRRTIIAVMTVLGVIFGGSGVWAYGVITDVKGHVVRVEQEEKANAKYGFELANGLRRDVQENASDIDKLQILHQEIREQDRIGPAKEK